MIYFLQQVIIPGIGNNPVGIIYMARAKRPYGYHAAVNIEPGNNILKRFISHYDAV